jgi:hypothetical protein
MICHLFYFILIPYIISKKNNTDPLYTIRLSGKVAIKLKFPEKIDEGIEDREILLKF